jgi:hypothetical protein
MSRAKKHGYRSNGMERMQVCNEAKVVLAEGMVMRIALMLPAEWNNAEPECNVITEILMLREYEGYKEERRK